MYELPSTAQWCFDVQWCPRNPEMISVASFDGHICVYSLLGGGAEESKEPAQVRLSYDLQLFIIENLYHCILYRCPLKLTPVIHFQESVHSPH